MFIYNYFLSLFRLLVVFSLLFNFGCTEPEIDKKQEDKVSIKISTGKSIIQLTSFSAIVGGGIEISNAEQIIARGVCWSKTQNPTIELSTRTFDGTTSGVFYSKIIGLDPNTTYYVRAYATTLKETIYGEQINFTTRPTVSDIDGNIYNTITIGEQTWMIENLKTTRFNNGTLIPNVTDKEEWAIYFKAAYCNYNNDTSNVAIYGRLYNWYAIKTNKLAPIGWHVPTDADWIKLIEYLIANGYNYDKTKAEDKIAKSIASNIGWHTSDYIGTPGDSLLLNNSSGFNGLPAGLREPDGNFKDLGISTIWWCSDVRTIIGNAKYRILSYDYLDFYGSQCDWDYGVSVRCIKD